MSEIGMTAEVSGGFMTETRLRCLLTIAQLASGGQRVSSRAIAARLNIKPPSVCKLLGPLAEEGMILKEPYGKVELTPKGMRCAEAYRRRIEIMRVVLMKRLRLSPEAGYQAALYFASSMDEASRKAILSIAAKSKGGECSL